MNSLQAVGGNGSTSVDLVRPRSSTRFATIFVLAVCLSILVISSWRIYIARLDQIAESEVAATNLAKALSEHATATFLQADALLRGVVERVETDGLERSSIERIHKVLRAEMKQLPQLQRLALIDADGRWITTDLDETIPDTGNHQDREYFRYHIEHSDAVVHLGPPIKSRLHGEWILTISRRINRLDGSFAGVVLAAIRLSYFNGYFQQFEIGNEGAIVLAMSNGTVIDRRPFKADLIGQSLANAPLFRNHIAFDESGVVRLKSAIDGIERLTAFQKLETFPAYVIVAFSEDQVLRGWVSDSIIQGGATFVLVVVLALLGRRLVSQVASRHADQLALIASQNALHVLNNQLNALAKIDSLTGLANRREFDTAIEIATKHIERHGGTAALIMIDIDWFKSYNDHLGHPQGDICLKSVAALIQQSISRPDDLAARFGGEEFAMLLPATTAEGAVAVAKKLQRALSDLRIPHPRSRDCVVSVSIGIAELIYAREKKANALDLLTHADIALYEAKGAGRDRIRVFRSRVDLKLPMEFGAMPQA